MKVLINGKTFNLKENQTILNACTENKINIPTLCYHKYLSSEGKCRLCVVKANGRIITSCDNYVSEGMEIITNDYEINKIRKTNLELILNNTDVNKFPENSEISKLISDLSPETEFSFTKKYYYENPFFSFDSSICVECGRCVNACHNIQCRFIWNFINKGNELMLIPGDNGNFENAGCEYCGTCVDFCPTGALKNKTELKTIKNEVETICGFCGVGCKIRIQTDGKNIVVKPKQNGKYNSLCVKGRYGNSYVLSDERLKKPLIKKYLLENKSKNPNDEFVEIDWNTALEIVTDKLVEIKKKYGGRSIGFFTSAKFTNEENYLMQKLARQIFKTNNIDHCARLCHSSTVTGLIKAVGSGAMTNGMDDIVDNAKTIFIIGANITEQHPVFGVKIRQAVKNNGTKLIVADPRFTGISEFSDIHLGHNGGSDVVLINLLCKIIIDEGWEDKNFIAERCENFDDFKSFIQSLDVNSLLEITGIDYETLKEVARLIALNKPASVIWAMGITQHTHGVDNVLALANLQMLTGNLGIEGSGLNPLRGQNNVQGACDVGGLPNVFSGYQKVTDEQAVNKFSSAWAFENDEKYDNKPGLTVTEIVDKFGGGEIKALYVAGENPVMSDPDVNKVKKLLKNGEFLILQDIFFTETAKFADIILPAASFAEKEGTFTNTERKIQKLNPLFSPLNDSKTDFEIIKTIANKLINKLNLKPTGDFADWNYNSQKDVMKEIGSLVPIYAGINYERLENGEDLRWPVHNFEHKGTKILHKDKFSRRKALFHKVEYKPPFEIRNKEFPFLLNTGRELFHWHGGELTRRVQEILSVSGESVIMINSQDADELNLKNGDYVKVRSKRGEIISKAFITNRIKRMTVFGNFHFPEANVNELTIKALDPDAKIPEYKVCAVNLEKIKKM